MFPTITLSKRILNPTSTNTRALQRDRKNQLIDESALKLHLASTQAMVSDCACEDIQCMHRFEDI
jgi:hypothetical protein